ncbi:MAG: glycosyltransferase family 39 protein [Thermoflexales bacterium]|nr:glycosyltransferase family 39 protein [Thermoflexales bacterium]
MLDGFRQSRWATPLTLAVLALATLLANACGRATFPFWPDEAYTALAARARDWNELLTIVLRNEATPPLYFALARLWAIVWGEASEASLRLFSAACLAGTVPLVGWLGQRLWSRKVGLAGALLLAVNPFAHYYGQEARVYAFTLLVASAVMLAAHTYLHSPRPSSWAVYVSTGAALLYTNYFAGFALAGIAAWVGLLLLKREQNWRKRLMGLGKWGLAHLAILLLLAPWLPGAVYQQVAVAVPTLTPEGRNILLQYMLALLVLGGSLPDGSLAGAVLVVLVALALLSALALALRRGDLEQRTFIATTVLAPPLLVLLVVFRGDAQFNTRYILPSLPAYVLLMAAGLGQSWRWQRVTRVLLAATAILSLVYCFAAAPNSRRLGGWDKMARIVETQARDTEDGGDAVFIAPPWARPAFTVQYTGDLPVHGAESFAAYYYEQQHAFDENLDTAALHTHLQRGGRAWIAWDRVYAPRPELPAGVKVEEYTFGSTSLLIVNY